MADSRTLGWKVLPSHKDCSWLTTVPIPLRMPKKRSGTKDTFVEQSGLSSVKHRASTDYTSLAIWNVTIPLLFWKATSNTLTLSTDFQNSSSTAICLCCTKSLRKHQHCFPAERTLFWKSNSSLRKAQCALLTPLTSMSIYHQSLPNGVTAALHIKLTLNDPLTEETMEKNDQLWLSVWSWWQFSQGAPSPEVSSQLSPVFLLLSHSFSAPYSLQNTLKFYLI